MINFSVCCTVQFTFFNRHIIDLQHVAVLTAMHKRTGLAQPGQVADMDMGFMLETQLALSYC